MREITEEMLDELRASVERRMSPKRFLHTAAVERAVIWLGELYCPEQILQLRAAALLHDITKELSKEEQIALCHRLGVAYDDDTVAAPKTFHAITAAALIPIEYPDFAREDIIGEVRYHTTGKDGMTIGEMLVYLADYIDDTRTFDDCVTLRNEIKNAHPEACGREERMQILYRVMKRSFDMTIRGLLEKGTVISRDTVSARNDMVKLIGEEKKG